MAAGFWLMLAAVEVAPLASDSWNWHGSVSWRKPIVFAVSVGLLMATIGWVLDRLPRRPRLAGTIAWTFLGSASLEVGLITLQTARGRASHFNVLEADDALVFSLMGVAVGVMSLCIVEVLIWSAVERPKDPLVRVAATPEKSVSHEFDRLTDREREIFDPYRPGTLQRRTCQNLVHLDEYRQDPCGAHPVKT